MGDVDPLALTHSTDGHKSGLPLNLELKRDLKAAKLERCLIGGGKLSHSAQPLRKSLSRRCQSERKFTVASISGSSHRRD